MNELLSQRQFRWLLTRVSNLSKQNKKLQLENSLLRYQLHFLMSNTYGDAPQPEPLASKREVAPCPPKRSRLFDW